MKDFLAEELQNRKKTRILKIAILVLVIIILLAIITCIIIYYNNIKNYIFQDIQLKLCLTKTL